MAKPSTSNSDALDYEAKLLQEAIKYQQDRYELWSDWNVYEENEYEYLKDLIGYGLFQAPKFGDSATMYAWMSKQEAAHCAYKDDERNIINLVFQKIIKHGFNKQSNGVILCGIIYNVIYKKEDKKKSNVFKDQSETGVVNTITTGLQVYPVPVFKVRVLEIEKKKIFKRKGDVRKYVEKTYYIDNTGRVYKAFGNYLAHNTLPKCTMVVPKGGMYQADPASVSSQNVDTGITKVWLEVHESPACKTTAKVLLGGDVITGVMGVAAVGVGIAAVANPIGAGIALASTVSAGVSCAWNIGRCSQVLADRGIHGESINVTNKKALGAWIGIAGSTVGLAASGGTLLLARAIRTGAAVGKVATIVHDSVQIGNMVVNGVEAGLKSYDVFATIVKKKKSDQSANDAILTAHIFFLFNSVINVRITRDVIELTQGQLLSLIEANLRRNRHRQEIQRITRNTNAAGSSDVSGNEEIIRCHKKINNEYELRDMVFRKR